MPYALKTPLDLKKVELSAAFFRTHLGHRENATELAIGLIRKGVETERASAGDDPFEIECTDTAERWAISHIIQGCYVEEYHHWEKAIKQYYKGQRELNGLSDDFDWRLSKATFVKRAIDLLTFFGTVVYREHRMRLAATEGGLKPYDWITAAPGSSASRKRSG